MHTQPHISEDTLVPRIALGITAVAIPATGMLAWSTEIVYNPMLPRWGLSLAASLALAGSFLHPTLRTSIRKQAFALATATTLWFTYVGYRNGFTVDDAFGLVALAALGAILVDSRVQLVGFIALSTLALVTVGASIDTRFPMGLAVLLFICMSAGIGSANLSRQKLSSHLARANSELERAVEARTHELQTSLTRLQAEVLDRERAELLAESASQAKSNFLATMSHELRTPLNAILGYAEIIEEDLEDSGLSQALEDLGKLHRSAHTLLALIDQVLDLARIETGQIRGNPQTMAVRVVVERSVESTRSVWDHGNRVQIDIDPELEAEFEPVWIEQILCNLLSNAQKFTQDGDIRVRARIDESELIITVSDTGVGMPEDAAAVIFERFTQLDGSRTRRHDGAGLGLAICRELTARMGGNIHVESAPNAGASFTVRLPLGATR